jgi:hypothetical protein
VTSYDDSTQIEIRIGETKMTVNGKLVDLPVAAKVVNGNTYLPLRALCEALGKQVTYFKGVISIADFSLEKETDLLNALNKMYSLKE